MVWTSDVPGDEEHPGVTIAASLVLVVIGLLALWGAWEMVDFALAVTKEDVRHGVGRRRGNISFVWWAIVTGLGCVGSVFVLGGLAWLGKGVGAALKGEKVR